MLNIAVLWIISPLPLAIALIVLYVKYDAIKKERDELREKLGLNEPVSAPPPVLKTLPPMSTTRAPSAHSTLIQPAPAAVTPVKVREKTGNEKKQAVNATLITGVLLVVAAGLIFATTTWRIIPAVLKVVLIGSIALLFFVVSCLAEKKFKLKMTAIAFYHLGCIFVPVSILSIGYFRLFGSWFSIGGGGTYWLQFTMAVTFGILAYLGYRYYRQASFYYCSWAASACAVWLLFQGVSNDWRVSFLWVSIYGAGVATWAILAKGKTWLIKFHPAFVVMCTLQALHIYCPDLQWFFVASGVCMLLWFMVYYNSGRILPCSFDTDCSRWIFPGLTFLIVITQEADLGTGTALLLLLGVCLCVAFLFIQYQEMQQKMGIAWTLPVLGGLVFYLTLTLWGQHSTLEFPYRYFILYTVLIFGLAMAKWGLQGKYHSGYLRDPAMALTVLLAFIGTMWIRKDSIEICMLWELVFLCVYLRKNKIYEVGATILCLFMPAITARLLGVIIIDGMCWLLIAATGVCYYKGAHSLEREGYYKNVLRYCGLTGLYLGVVGAGAILAVVGLLLPEIIFFLVLIAVTNAIFYKKHGNLAYAGVNLFLFPLVWCGLIHHTDMSMDVIRTVMAVLGILMMGAGRVLFPTILKVERSGVEDGTSPSYRIDYLGLAAVLSVFYLQGEVSHWWSVAQLLLLALWFANGYGRQSEFLDAVLAGGVAFTLYGVTARFIHYELSSETGFMIIAVQGLLYCLLAYIKREHRCGRVLKYSGLFGFYTGSCLAIFLLFTRTLVSPWLAIGLLALIVAADVIGEKTGEAFSYAMINMAIIPIIIRYASLMGVENKNLMPIGLVTGGLMMLGGRLLCPGAYERGENGSIWKLDYLGISAVMGLFLMESKEDSGLLLYITLLMAMVLVLGGLFLRETKPAGDNTEKNMYPWMGIVIPILTAGYLLTRGDEKLWLFVLCIYGGIWWLNWCKRKHTMMSHIAIANAFIMFFCGFYYQPFVKIPDILLLEYLFADFLLFGLLAGIVWKNKREWVQIYWFILTAFFAVCQGVACIVLEEGTDVLILGIAMLVALVVAYRKKNLSWLSLSLGTLVALVLYMTKSFWLSIAWWVYLLLAGLFLIGMAAYHEYKKRETKSSEKRITDWTWKV